MEFGQDDENEEDSDVDYNDDDLEGVLDSDDDTATMKTKSKKKQALNREVSEELIKSLIKKTFANSGSLSSLKKLLSIFRIACIPMSSSSKSKHGDDEDDSDSEFQTQSKSSRYIINTPELYEIIMSSVIEISHRAFYRFLDISDVDIAQITETSLTQHPKWKNISLLILSYFKSIMHTLKSLSDTFNQGKVSVLLINSLEKYIPLLIGLPRLAKHILKILLIYWAKDISIDEDVSNLRGHAFIRIRQLAIQLTGNIPEECFRSLYLSFSRTCKSFNEIKFSTVIFMSQCVVELYSTDASLAYQQGFLHIRQLALHVRQAILRKSSDQMHHITNWQFLNCIRLWTRVICSMPGNNEMGVLAFPLSQIILGIISITQSLYYMPLKLHLITCLHQLSASCKLYIPVAMKILEVFDSNDMLLSKSTPSTEAPPNFMYLVKLPSNSINSAVVRDSIINQSILTLRHNIEIYRYHVAFPEYSYIISKRLKLFNKKAKVSKWRDLTRTLLGQIEEYVNFCKQHRNSLNQPPAFITEFEPLLPSNGSVQEAKIRLNKLLNNSSNNINALTSMSDNVIINAAASTSSKSSKKINKSIETDTGDIVEETEDDIEVKPKAPKKSKKPKLKSTKKAKSSIVDLNVPDTVGDLDWSDDDQ